MRNFTLEGEIVIFKTIAISKIVFQSFITTAPNHIINHGTIIRTRMLCKKAPCYIRDSACRWLIVENAKIFRSYVKHFRIFPRERSCRILICLCKQVLMNHPIMFLDRDNKTKLVPASFSYFLELL